MAIKASPPCSRTITSYTHTISPGVAMNKRGVKERINYYIPSQPLHPSASLHPVTRTLSRKSRRLCCRKGRPPPSAPAPYQTMKPGDFDAVDTRLGEAEFVIVEVLFANYANDDDTETLYMAYVRKPLTVVDSPLMCPEPQAAFFPRGGAHEAILCEHVLDFGRLIRSGANASVYVVRLAT